MNYTKEIHKFKSSNGINDITYYIYKPATPAKAIFQISHGMCEYVERYEHFIEYLTGLGYLVCGNDHLGHKNSVATKDDLGYFAPKDGWTCLPKDLAILTQKMKDAYPELPLILFGHSMGSFIARAYLIQFGDLIDGAIICGTAGTNPILGLGQFMIKTVRAIKGERYRSTLLDNAMFGQYNKKYKTVRTPKDWLTHDEAIVDKYMNDEYCMFLFTASAFYDLTLLLGYVNSDEWYQNLPKDLPVFLISGDMDPVGNWGKGVKEVETKIKAQNLKDFRCKLYPEYRHEILNEIGKENVYKDISNWLDSHLKKR